MRDWLAAYGVTLAVEVPVAFGLLRLLGWVPGRMRTAAALATLWAVNLTHPVVWLLRPTTSAGLLVAEAVVVVVEAAALALAFRPRTGTRRLVTRTRAGDAGLALLVALGANVASFVVGVALYHAGVLSGS